MLADPAGISPSNPSHATQHRQRRGKRAYLSGLAAEEIVARAYMRHGCALVGRRLRAGPGEIDLVFRRGELLVFVEVKSSASHARAAQALTPVQLNRLIGAAESFVQARPEFRCFDMRIDLATVDGTGRLRVVPNITL